MKIMLVRLLLIFKGIIRLLPITIIFIQTIHIPFIGMVTEPYSRSSQADMIPIL